jgi:hypothetical protein
MIADQATTRFSARLTAAHCHLDLQRIAECGDRHVTAKRFHPASAVGQLELFRSAYLDTIFSAPLEDRFNLNASYKPMSPDLWPLVDGEEDRPFPHRKGPPYRPRLPRAAA